MEKLTLLYNLNLEFIEIFFKKTDFLILTLDDSFNWSKQFMISDNKELLIFIINGLTSGLELLEQHYECRDYQLLYQSIWTQITGFHFLLEDLYK